MQTLISLASVIPQLQIDDFTLQIGDSTLQIADSSLRIGDSSLRIGDINVRRGCWDRRLDETKHRIVDINVGPAGRLSISTIRCFKLEIRCFKLAI
jgi:hypothetical protein